VTASSRGCSRRLKAWLPIQEPSGCRKLRGYKDLWRIRVGDYRVVYIIDDDHKTVSVTRVAHQNQKVALMRWAGRQFRSRGPAYENFPELLTRFGGMNWSLHPLNFYVCHAND
jgi:hypothetical protein